MKKALIVCLMMAMSISLMGCGSKKSDSETTTTEATTESSTEATEATTTETTTEATEADSSGYNIANELNVHSSEGTALFDTKYFELYMPTSVDWDYEVDDARTISFYYTESKDSGNGGWVGSLKAYDKDDESYQDEPDYQIAGESDTMVYVYLLPTDVQYGSSEEDQYMKLLNFMKQIDVEQGEDNRFMLW